MGKTAQVVEEQQDEIERLNGVLRERADPAARGRIVELEQKLRDVQVQMKDDNVAAQQRLRAKSVEIESMSVELQRKEQEINTLQHRFAEAREAAEYWKNEVSVYAGEGQAVLAADLTAGGGAELANLQAEVADYETQIQQLRSDAEEQREEYEACDRALRDAEREKAALQKLKEKYERVSGEREAQLATFKEQLEGLKGTVQHDERALAVQLEAANAELRRLQEENDDLRGEVARQAHVIAQHRAGDAVNEMVEREAQTKSARVQEAEMTKREIRKAQAQIGAKEARIKALQTENDGLLTENAALTEEKDRLQNDLDSEREELAAARSDLEEMLEQGGDKELWRAELERLESELIQKRQEADDLREHLRVAEAALDELKSKVGKSDHTAEAVSHAAGELSQGVAGGLVELEKLAKEITALRNVAGTDQNNDLRRRSNKLLYTLSAALDALNKAGLEVQGLYEDAAAQLGVDTTFTPFGAEFVDTIFAQIYFEEGEPQETMEKVCKDFVDDLDKRFKSIEINVECLAPTINDAITALSTAVGQ